jgi:predicted neuraminidase
MDAKKLDSEELATWVQDQLLDADTQATASPPVTVANSSNFELTTAAGERALITVELLA